MDSTSAGAAEDLSVRTRDDFPLLSTAVDGNPVVYLDNAATSLKPRQVVDAVTHYYTAVSANIHRGKHYLSETASDEFEVARLAVATYTGFRGNEVVFTANTTAALNLVAQSLPVAPDDTVLVSFDGHHSALLPWRGRARVRHIPLDDGAEVDLDRYADLLRSRPRVVVLNHCSNVTGIYAPVERMARMAKEVGAVTVVDAAQSLPHRKVNCQDIDFLVFSAHKMLGPTGLGVLCGRYDHLATLAPPALGGGVVDWVDTERFEPRKLPHRLEAGTPHIAGVYGLHAALRYLTELGDQALREHDRVLGSVLLTEASTRPRLRVIGAGEHADRGGILSFGVEGSHRLKEMAKILSDTYGIMCRTGHMCAQPLVDRFTDGEVLRVSAYLYNTVHEIKSLFSAIDEVVDVVSATR